MKNINNKQNRKISIILVLIILIFPGCQKDFLEQAPKTSISEQIFWRHQADAYQALTGVYSVYAEKGGERIQGFGKSFVWLSSWAGYSSWRNFGHSRGVVVEPSSPIPPLMWRLGYQSISRANYFLENIGKVNMDETEKKSMIAEVRFLRAFSLFWLNQWFGDIPLVTKVLTFNEANSILQTPSAQVRAFILDELGEIATDLPVKHPESQSGRIEKGAAMALKGRLLMAEKRWQEAAGIYADIMNLNRYSIDPRWKELFQVQGDNNSEAIFVIKYHESEQGGEAMSQHTMRSSLYGGFNACNLFKHFVDEFRMTDGLRIEDSPLFDPDNPYDNRDPRLYKTMLIADYSVVPIDGKIFKGDPATIVLTGQTGANISGYLLQKWWDWAYKGTRTRYGGDYMHIRYPEVLLGRLESEMEAGTTVTQTLLDNTINLIRQRAEIDMPPVLMSDFANNEELKKIIINERWVELACEGGIHYFDLLRTGKLVEEAGQVIKGMRMTNDPENYTGLYNIDDEGYLIIGTITVDPHNVLWPIPLTELDVNPNLKQNPGYH